ALAKLSGETLVASGVTVAQIGTVLGLGVAPGDITVSDTAARIEADLIAGSGSNILSNLSAISRVTVSDSGTIVLTEAQLTAAGVDDGTGSALSKVAGGTLAVTGVTVAHIATVLGLGVPPNDVSVSDTTANIQADLGSGTSVILANRASIADINASDAGTATLTIDLQQLTDNGDVFGRISSATNITLTDTGAHVQTDLRQGSASVIGADAGVIAGITLSSGAVSLTAGEALSVAMAALNKLPAGSLTVTDVPVADIAGIAGLTALSEMAVLDSSVLIRNSLRTFGASSPLETDAGKISGIGFSAGTSISLTDTEAQPVLGALAKLPTNSLIVTNVSLADITSIAGLTPVLSNMTVLDGAATIRTELVTDGAASPLETHAGLITAIAFSSGSSFTLSDAQAQSVLAALANLPTASLIVSGVLVADIASRAAIGSLDHMTVLDTAAHIQADLASVGPASEIVTRIAAISLVVVTDAGTIVLTEA